MFKKFVSRRNSEVPSVPKEIQVKEVISTSSSPRRHSLPECTTDKNLLEQLAEQSLYTIQENENMTSKSPTINISPIPKEKKPFQFFRTRTLSSSSNESGGTGGSGGITGGSVTNIHTTSPRLSIFDKVRKRSQSDAKSSSIDHVNSNLTHFQQNLQRHLQDQLAKELQQKAKHEVLISASCPYEHSLQKRFNNGNPITINRQNLSHSISEECDGDSTSSSVKPYGPISAAVKINNSQRRTQSLKHKINHNEEEKCEQVTDFNNMENNQIFSYFMKHKFCYDIMPKSAKVVVFDTKLLVKKAFFALIYNGVRSAPLWDSKNQKYIGMLTITDFILILQKYYREPNKKIEELEDHRLETWREVLKEYSRPFIYLRPDDTLFDAIKTLSINKVHRLPIIDPITGNVVCIVTHKRILRYLYLFIYDMPQPDFLQKSLADLKLGTYENIITVVKETPLTEVLNIFVASRVSALPVVDENKKLVNIYSKFDVIDLAAEKTYNNLDVSVIEALQYRKSRFDGVAKCKKDELLVTIMERIVKKEVHRLVIVDDEDRVIGILSLSDILTFIVLKQEAHNKNAAQLTTAFGLTRLSSIGDQHVNITNRNESNIDNRKLNSGSLSSNEQLNDSNISSMNSGDSSPQAITTIQQPQSSHIDQAIFEDDPMEITEPIK